MTKFTKILNGNRVPIIMTLTIILALLGTSFSMSSQVLNLKDYVDEKVDKRVDEELALIEYKIDKLQEAVDYNHLEIINLIKE